MRMGFSVLAVRSFLVSLLLFPLAAYGGEHAALAIQSAVRHVTLIEGGRVLKNHLILTVVNERGREVEGFRLAFGVEEFNRMGHIYFAGEESAKVPLGRVKGRESDDEDVVELEAPVTIKKDDRGRELHFMYWEKADLRPLPAAAPFDSNQKTVLTLSATILSPYGVGSQMLSLALPKGRVLEASGHEDLEYNAAKSRYEFTDNTKRPPYTSAKQLPTHLKFHYRNENHLGVLTSVKRQIDVSLWGAAKVKEFVEFQNDAASLSTEFNRWEVASHLGVVTGRRRLTNAPVAPHHACFSLECWLPPDAHAIEFYDHIGNISTSYARPSKHHVVVNVEPRFPVLGGWKADWFLEYSLALKSIMNYERRSGVYRLRLPLGHSYRKVFAESTSLSLTLPSGSHSIRVSLPRSVSGDEEWQSFGGSGAKPLVRVGSRFGWLDIWRGRPTVDVAFGGYVLPDDELLAHQIEVQFQNPYAVSLLRKPIGCVLSAASLFFATILCLQGVQLRRRLKRLGGAGGDTRATEKSVASIVNDIITATEAFVQACTAEEGDARAVDLTVRWRAECKNLQLRLNECIAGAHGLALDTRKSLVARIAEKVEQFMEQTEAEVIEMGAQAKKGRKPSSATYVASRELEKLVNDLRMMPSPGSAEAVPLRLKKTV